MQLQENSGDSKRDKRPSDRNAGPAKRGNEFLVEHSRNRAPVSRGKQVEQKPRELDEGGMPVEEPPPGGIVGKIIAAPFALAYGALQAFGLAIASAIPALILTVGIGAVGLGILGLFAGEGKVRTYMWDSDKEAATEVAKTREQFAKNPVYSRFAEIGPDGVGDYYKFGQNGKIESGLLRYQTIRIPERNGSLTFLYPRHLFVVPNYKDSKQWSDKLNAWYTWYDAKFTLPGQSRELRPSRIGGDVKIANIFKSGDSVKVIDYNSIPDKRYDESLINDLLKTGNDTVLVIDRPHAFEGLEKTGDNLLRGVIKGLHKIEIWPFGPWNENSNPGANSVSIEERIEQFKIEMKNQYAEICPGSGEYYKFGESGAMESGKLVFRTLHVPDRNTNVTLLYPKHTVTIRAGGDQSPQKQLPRKHPERQLLIQTKGEVNVEDIFKPGDSVRVFEYKNLGTEFFDVEDKLIKTGNDTILIIDRSKM